jgi:hypothetical protein
MELMHVGCLDPVVLIDGAAQNPIRWRFGFFGEVEDVGVSCGHGRSSFNVIIVHITATNTPSDQPSQAEIDG